MWKRMFTVDGGVTNLGDNFLDDWMVNNYYDDRIEPDDLKVYPDLTIVGPNPFHPMNN